MTSDERKKLYQALSAPFSDACIQRTEGRITGRGYDTVGLGYQHIVNRLNETLGVGGFRMTRKVSVKEVATSKGRPAYEASCELVLQLGEWVDGNFVPFAEAIGDGGHTSMAYADAVKGSTTNALKKTAAFFGVGRQAYEGTLDDDVPAETNGDRWEPRPAPQVTPRPAPQEASRPVPEVARLPPPHASPAPAPQPERNRITSKQLGAINAISKKLGMEQRQLRSHVRETFGCQPEFLSREQASQLITTMSATGPGNGNGAGHATFEREVGEAG